MGEWLLGLIVEASKLPAPHRFPTPKRFLGAGNAALMAVNGLEDAVRELQGLGKPFLDWAGKAERLSMDVPTLPLFIHQRLSTQAILATLKGHKREGVDDQASLFGDPQRPLAQRMKPYEHRDKWVNRMVLGDSLVVMNSLLEYEGMGGQVQMIYMDPPYGVRFGSNFQPFVRKRDVKDNDDADLTREPEMVQAYRDTWELGLHSYLTYLRDRLIIARDLLSPQGSVFVQITDENVHHVREMMAEVFGIENFVAEVVFQKAASATSELLAGTADLIVWFAKHRPSVKYRRLFTYKLDQNAGERYDQLELHDGARRPLNKAEKAGTEELPAGARKFQLSALTSSRPPGDFPVTINRVVFKPRTGYWKTGVTSMENLIRAQRVVATQGGTLRYVRYADDFAFQEVASLWTDISGGVQSRSDPKVYAVKTSSTVV